MQNAIKQEIKRLSQKAFKKVSIAARLEEQYRNQFKKRTGNEAGIKKPHAVIEKPKWFDPLHCKRNANFLSKVIWHKVLNNTYRPHPAINYLMPKPDGSKRSIMAFSIPDAALANVIMRRSRDRNIKRLSPSSYAYHPDKNVFDAVLALTDYRFDGKLFAVQIDFEKYFDNIPTSYLRRKINDANQVSLTPHEKYIFESFLTHQYSEINNITNGPYNRRHRGTPQGSSVSLLLSNLANHDLDLKLSAESGKFVRFADDVVALCDSYESALELERCFITHCKESGLIINKNKSPGISIISYRQEEMRTYGHFDYLGYRFSENGLGDYPLDAIRSPYPTAGVLAASGGGEQPTLRRHSLRPHRNSFRGLESGGPLFLGPSRRSNLRCYRM